MLLRPGGRTVVAAGLALTLALAARCRSPPGALAAAPGRDAGGGRDRVRQLRIRNLTHLRRP